MAEKHPIAPIASCTAILDEKSARQLLPAAPAAPPPCKCTAPFQTVARAWRMKMPQWSAIMTGGGLMDRRLGFWRASTATDNRRRCAGARPGGGPPPHGPAKFESGLSKTFCSHLLSQMDAAAAVVARLPAQCQPARRKTVLASRPVAPGSHLRAARISRSLRVCSQVGRGKVLRATFLLI